jgi:Family of unknown function (DUF6893)
MKKALVAVLVAIGGLLAVGSPSLRRYLKIEKM